MTRKSLLSSLRAPAALAVTALALAAPSQASAASCENADTHPGAVSGSVVRAATLCLLNAERAQHGLKKLRKNGELRLAAKRHAKDMANRNYFAHDSLDGSSFVDRILRTNYVGAGQGWTMGENLGWGGGSLATPAAMVKGWMESPGHRANILNGRFREIGIGVVNGAPVSGQRDAATYATSFGARF